MFIYTSWIGSFSIFWLSWLSCFIMVIKVFLSACPRMSMQLVSCRLQLDWNSVSTEYFHLTCDKNWLKSQVNIFHLWTLFISFCLCFFCFFRVTPCFVVTNESGIEWVQFKKSDGFSIATCILYIPKMKPDKAKKIKGRNSTPNIF